MTRRVLFQIHWFLGITAGLVLAVMGVTGAMMSFEDEIMAALSPGVVTVPAAQGPSLSPDMLVARASAQRDGLTVTSVTIASDPHRSALVAFAPVPGKKGRGDESYVDPYSGKLLGHAKGADLFAFVRTVHRWLALPGGGNGWGRQITGIAALSLIYFALSGLYLRWPRRPLDWRAWFVLDLRKTGRNLYRTLHSVIGGWVLVFYLLSAATGLWWSYDWYHGGVSYALTGKAGRDNADSPERAAKNGKHQQLATAWDSFEAVTGGKFDTVRVTIPSGKKPVVFRSLRLDARHDRMTDDYRIDAKTGEIKKADLYARRALGQTITTSMLELHRGAFFGLAGRLVMLLTSLTMPLFAVTGLLLYVGRRRKKRELAAIDTPPPATTGAAAKLLVVYASQTGTAERLARQTAAAFDGARIVAIARLDEAMLAQAKRAVFVASTYGEGEPPDLARSFARRMLHAPAAAAHLDYAVLALGDREYADFCAFGHQIDRWLHAGGGKRLFDIVEMDGEDADAQRQWQQQIATIGARGDIPDWQPAAYDRWRLVERHLVNPGSAGNPAFHIALEPIDGANTGWEAGDIAEIAPQHDPSVVKAWLDAAGLSGAVTLNGVSLASDLAGSILPDSTMIAGMAPSNIVAALRPLPHREYSIASIVADGQVQLLVRQAIDAEGRLGLGSGWLTEFAPLGSEIALRLRANPNFRVSAGDTPMILIGNGTGLAGLRAHLRQRAADGIGRNWLIFGERNAAFDAFHEHELLKYRASGLLDRLDRVWSRDAGGARYVQDQILLCADAFRDWVANGAAIYVCGSIDGMAPAVDDAVRAMLGDQRVEELIETNRYRRDIY